MYLYSLVASGIISETGMIAGYKKKREVSGMFYSPPKLRVLPQPEMRHWVPAGAQELGRLTVATLALRVTGEESLISMMSLFRVFLTKSGCLMILAASTNCSLPSRTLMLCSPSLTWMRLLEAEGMPQSVTLSLKTVLSDSSFSGPSLFSVYEHFKILLKYQTLLFFFCEMVYRDWGEWLLCTLLFILTPKSRA